MGGYGSTRWGWHTKATTVEECRTIDIFSFSRDVDLKSAGAAGNITWDRNGRTIASICWRVNNNSLRLIYTVTKRSGEKKDYDYTVPITWTRCNFGGQRPWFVCPNTNCGRRVGKLYMPPGGDVFLCRHCWDLTYESCQDSHKYDRLFAGIAADVGMGLDGKDVERLLKSKWK